MSQKYEHKKGLKQLDTNKNSHEAASFKAGRTHTHQMYALQNKAHKLYFHGEPLRASSWDKGRRVRRLFGRSHSQRMWILQ